jgi:glucose-6-phosphate 1-dehydrogenase
MSFSVDEKTRSSSNFFGGRRDAEDCLLIIYGGSGDLAKRKLFPSLANLLLKKQLPARFKVLAVGRKAMTVDELLSMGTYSDEFRARFMYVQTDYDAAGVEKLKSVCDAVCREDGIAPNYLHYLAVPPKGYAELARALSEGGLVHPPKHENWSRLVVEKPYGRDHASAIDLDESLLSCFAEKQIYRIDHYLGKETVQNLMVFRFANSVFEPIWNHHHIDHIQISGSEMLGVEDRAGYFDKSGILRDMVQNHLMQIFCMVTMEPPVNLTAEAIRDEKVKVLRAMRALDLKANPPVAVRGQYGPGSVKGADVPGYREEKGVAPETSTETFVALRLNVDNPRWAGVPFYLRSGKRMGRKGTEVVVTFKPLPNILFNAGEQKSEPNRIVFKIQPQEAILLELTSKNPGQSFELSDTSMNFCYSDHFDTSADGYELSWKFLDELLKHWAETPAGKTFPNYAAGSNHPQVADEVMLPGTKWLDFSKWDNVCP